MGLLDGSNARVIAGATRVRRYVRETPKGKLTWMALFSAAAIAGATSIGGLAGDVVKPWVGGLVYPERKLDSIGGEWKGYYVSPSSDADQRQPSDSNVAGMCHHKLTQSWDITQRGEKFTADVKQANAHKETEIWRWQASGFLKHSTTIAANIRGPVQGIGSFYLTRHSTYGYYRGYAYLCDCTAPKPNAVMVCPYVLYKADDPVQAINAKKDELFSGDPRCRTLTQTGPLELLPVPAPKAPASGAAVAPCIP